MYNRYMDAIARERLIELDAKIASLLIDGDIIEYLPQCFRLAILSIDGHAIASEMLAMLGKHEDGIPTVYAIFHNGEPYILTWPGEWVMLIGKRNILHANDIQSANE